MRRAVKKVLGEEKYEFFFDKVVTYYTVWAQSWI